MARRPKFQVFISSTYVDLHNEREAVVWRVLKARHIPVGMENFTATHDRGWETIQRVLEETDYYVLIFGGMYGSIDPGTGISWTQREYEYAIERGIPVIAFIRRESQVTVDKLEKTEAGRAKLDQFVARVRDAHLCIPWERAEDLAGAVVDALRNHIEDDEGTPRERPGWFRGDQVVRPEVANEMARLSGQNAMLQQEILARARLERFTREVGRFREAFKRYQHEFTLLLRDSDSTGDHTALMQHVVDFYTEVSRHFYTENEEYLGSDLQSTRSAIQGMLDAPDLKHPGSPDRNDRLREVGNLMMDFARMLYERSLKY
jgi:Domain of unknown function (DUF4062)